MRFLSLLLLATLTTATGCRPATPAVPGRLDRPAPCTPQPSYLKVPARLRVVGVFTTWSLSAQAQWSRFVKVSSRFPPAQVQFIAVFIDPDQRVVDEWVASERPSFRVVHDPHFGVCRRHVREVPVTLIFDDRDRVLTFYSGHVTSDTLAAQVRDALRRVR
jgi:hypothetical protein